MLTLQDLGHKGLLFYIIVSAGALTYYKALLEKGCFSDKVSGIYSNMSQKWRRNIRCMYNFYVFAIIWNWNEDCKILR